MVLTIIDVNACKDREALDDDLIKPAHKYEKDKKEAFDQICASRIGELPDGDDDEGLVQWSFDDFTIVRKLGSGGVASVFLAREKHSGYEVALKIQDDREDSILELDIHEPLKHPNIVEVIDYFFSEDEFEFDIQNKETEGSDQDLSVENNRKLVIMLEACKGGCLYDVVRNAPGRNLKEVQAARYIWDAVNAIEHIHQKGVIHCDVKPLNFLVDSFGNLKICDFGVSVAHEDREILGGSPAYMGPEHLMAWRHMSDNFDYRVDIYSLGVILFEMLVGCLPYKILDDKSEVVTAEDRNEDSFLDDFDKLGINEESEKNTFKPPVLDLRKLDDFTTDEPFCVPPPLFINGVVSSEAHDLILLMLEPKVDQRISLAEVKKHPWILRHTNQTK